VNCIEREFEREQLSRHRDNEVCQVNVTSNDPDDPNSVLGCRSWDEIAWEGWRRQEIMRRNAKDCKK
jgi:hypothetical protein